MLHITQFKLISEHHASEHTHTKPFWFKHPRRSVYSSVFSTTSKGYKRERMQHCSCNIFLLTSEPSLNKHISADSPSKRHTHSTHTPRGWAELSWRTGVLAQATLIEPQKHREKMRDWSCCSSLACALFHIFRLPKWPLLQLSMSQNLVTNCFGSTTVHTV